MTSTPPLASGYCMESMAERAFKFGTEQTIYNNPAIPYIVFADGSFILMPDENTLYLGVKMR